MKKIAVFASGQGSTFKHLLEAHQKNKLQCEITLLITSKNNIGAVQFAGTFNVPHHTVLSKSPSRGQEILSLLKKYDIDFIVLAGYLAKIDNEVIDLYKNKIINSHPSLLPKYGGKGMYGKKVHEAVIKNKEKTSGATIHYVTEEYDSGAIIAQEQISLTPEDTPESLEHKVKHIEKILLVQALNDIL